MLPSKSTDIALLLLRLTFGGLMLVNHGWGKLMKFFADEPLKFGDPLGLGAVPSLVLTTFAEAGCALLIVIGLFTRWATVPLIIAMFVAAFVVKMGDSLKEMEMALLYFFAFVAIGLAGPGWYSVDAQMRKP
jgi:putative oxidoreductase